MDDVLYDENGRPVAYFEHEGELLIYLWSGYVVAYLYETRVIGWNGHHLGWYSEGVVYDLHGLRVGSIGDKCLRALQIQRAKGPKHARGPKFARLPEYKRIDFRQSYAEQTLDDFLKQGIAGTYTG